MIDMIPNVQTGNERSLLATREAMSDPSEMAGFSKEMLKQIRNFNKLAGTENNLGELKDGSNKESFAVEAVLDEDGGDTSKEGLRTLPASAYQIPGLELNDPAMSLVKYYVHPEVQDIESQDLMQLRRLAGGREQILGRLAGLKTVEKASQEFSNAGSVKEISPEVYLSLMQKTKSLTTNLKDILHTSRNVAFDIVRDFNTIVHELKLNPDEENLLGKAVSVSFVGASNEQDGLQRLVSLLDLDQKTMEQILSQKNEDKQVDLIVPESSLQDLNSRGEIAKLARAIKMRGEDNQDTQAAAIKVPMGSNIAGENVDLRRVEVEGGELKEIQKVEVDVHNLVEKLGGKLAMIAKENGGEMKIRLKPESLGEISIRVLAKNDDVEIKVITSTTEAKNILETSLPRLRSNLQLQDLNLVKADVQLSTSLPGRDESRHMFFANQQHGERGSSFKTGRVSRSYKSNSAGLDLGVGPYGVPINRYGNEYNFVA